MLKLLKIVKELEVKETKILACHDRMACWNTFSVSEQKNGLNFTFRYLSKLFKLLRQWHARSWKGNHLRIILLGMKFFSVFLLQLTEKVKENLMIHLAIMLLACAISVFCHEHN